LIVAVAVSSAKEKMDDLGELTLPDLSENDPIIDDNSAIDETQKDEGDAKEVQSYQSHESSANAHDDIRGVYYAVRVGYALGSPMARVDNKLVKIDDNDGIHPKKKRKHSESETAEMAMGLPMVTIHSAIFLYWKDARQFIDTVSDLSEHTAEYEAFTSIQDAEDYLVARGENDIAAAEMEMFGDKSSEKKQKSKGGESVKWNPKKTKPRTPPLSDLTGSTSDVLGASSDEVVSAPSKSKKNKKGAYWDVCYQKLVKYKDANNGSIHIPEMLEGEENSPEVKELESMRRWCEKQARFQRRYSQGYTDEGKITPERIEKLRDVGFHLVPSYDEMYEKLAAHKAETGTLDVQEEDDEELYAWIKEQKNLIIKRVKGKPIPLSDGQMQNLKSLGFEIDHPAGGKISLATIDSAAEQRRWDSMLEAAIEYKEIHGHLKLPARNLCSEKDGKLHYWIFTQRREYKKLKEGKESRLTARRMQRLAAIGLDLSPNGPMKSWEQRMQSVREFAAEHGHCKIPKDHELGGFVSYIRNCYRLRDEGKKNGLTDERVNDLMEVGFVFNVNKRPVGCTTVRKSWEGRFQDLLAFKEEYGHTLVHDSYGPLAGWVRNQRDGYRKMKAGKQSAMTAEKALRLTEVGFHFDATRVRAGTNRHEYGC